MTSSARTAWGWGLATIASAGTVLDVWYPDPQLGGEPTPEPPHHLAALALLGQGAQRSRHGL